MYDLYHLWMYCGEFLALGSWGILLALVRRILFGKLCKEAALGNGEKGKMLKAMTLKFEKSSEVKVGIHDIPVFVQKYLCQEKKFGIRLGRWRRLPERWLGIILGTGFVEAVALRYLNYSGDFVKERFLAAAAAAAAVGVAILIFESDSLWERAGVLLLDYVANTLYPRQVHVYEGFEEEAAVAGTEKKEAAPLAEDVPPETAKQEKTKKGIVLGREEEQIFQEVLSDFLGSST